MQTLLGILLLLLLYTVCRYAAYLWREWSGAYGRWQKNEPLKLSDFLSKRWQEQREQHQREKADLRHRYEQNNSLILNAEFRRQFKFFGLHDDIRSEVMQRCNHTCGLCGKKPKRKGALHLDHIRPRVRYPELEFVTNNLQALCASCNRHKQAYDGNDWREVTQQRIKASKRRKSAERARQREQL